jgi:hypothetical protein
MFGMARAVAVWKVMGSTFTVEIVPYSTSEVLTAVSLFDILLNKRVSCIINRC